MVLQLTDNPKFNAWVRRLACKQRQPGPPVVIVQIGKLLPGRSRIRSPKLRVEEACGRYSACCFEGWRAQEYATPTSAQSYRPCRGCKWRAHGEVGAQRYCTCE